MYTVKGILVFKNMNEMTFIYGLVIEGPKQGIYLLDEFCMEWCNRALKWWNSSFYWAQQYFEPLVRKGKINTIYIDVDKNNDFITPDEYKTCRVFRRKKGWEQLKKLNILEKIQMPK